MVDTLVIIIRPRAYMLVKIKIRPAASNTARSVPIWPHDTCTNGKSSCVCGIFNGISSPSIHFPSDEFRKKARRFTPRPSGVIDATHPDFDQAIFLFAHKLSASPWEIMDIKVGGFKLMSSKPFYCCVLFTWQDEPPLADGFNSKREHSECK